MKKIFLSAWILIASAALVSNTTNKQLNLGDKAPLADLKMKNIDGKELTLNNLKGQNGLMVVFSSNTCPFVIGWEDQYNELYYIGKRENIGFVLINSNEAFRDNQDSPEAMKKKAEEMKYAMPYLIDENHRLADAFGAQTTPHVFLFDKNMKLVYKGSINDKYEEGRKEIASKFYAQDALFATSRGGDIKVKESKAIGCSIKRVKK